MLETVIITLVLAVLYGRARQSVQAQAAQASATQAASGAAGGIGTPGASLPPWATWEDALALGWAANLHSSQSGGFTLINPLEETVSPPTPGGGGSTPPGSGQSGGTTAPSGGASGPGAGAGAGGGGKGYIQA